MPCSCAALLCGFIINNFQTRHTTSQPMNDTNDKIIRLIFLISLGLIFIMFILVMINQPDEPDVEPPVRQETTNEFVERYITDFTRLGAAFDSCGFYKCDFNADYGVKPDSFAFLSNDPICSAPVVNGLQKLLYSAKNKYGLAFFAHRKDANFYRLVMGTSSSFSVLVMLGTDSIPRMEFVNDSTAMGLSGSVEMRKAILKEHGVTHVSGRVWVDM